ncbi:MAG: Sodium/solute symporter, partial [uncultured Gemmatimonadaceae bacterium]
GGRAGQAAGGRFLHGLRPAAHDLRRPHRRRLPLDGVARRRPAHRAAAALGALAARRQARDHRQRRGGDLPVRPLPDDRRGAVRALRRAAVPGGGCDLPDLHHRADAVGARGAHRGGDRRGDDEHALGRDQLARGGDHARHLPPAHRPERRRARDAAHGQAVRPRLGDRPHPRRPALPRGPEAAGGGRRARDRVVHLRRAARRLLPRHLLAARHPAGRDHRDVGGDLLHGVHRLRQAAERPHARARAVAAALRRDRVAVVRAHRHHDHGHGRHPLLAHPPTGRDGAASPRRGGGGGV